MLHIMFYMPWDCPFQGLIACHSLSVLLIYLIAFLYSFPFFLTSALTSLSPSSSHRLGEERFAYNIIFYILFETVMYSRTLRVRNFINWYLNFWERYLLAQFLKSYLLTSRLDQLINFLVLDKCFSIRKKQSNFKLT